MVDVVRNFFDDSSDFLLDGLEMLDGLVEFHNSTADGQSDRSSLV